MSEESSETKYSIEFDDEGRILVKDPKLAERLLRSATQREAMEVVITATLPANMSPGCVFPPVVNGVGCSNICPFNGMVRFGRPALDSGLAEQWKDFQEADASGPVIST
jgi:hypothetical protein